MSTKFILLYIFLSSVGIAQNQIKFWRPGDYNLKTNNADCDSKVKVIEAKQPHCDIGNASVLYPVIDEQFNFKEDLPNNWGFNMRYTLDSDYDLDAKYPFIWSGYDTAAYLNNLEVINGKCFLLLKKEKRLQKEPWSGSTLKNYEFTFADLNSLFTVHGGVFKCTMKLPENNLVWPAFWLRSNGPEIDIFEFYDGNVANNPFSNCNVYHNMRMGVGKKVGSTDCNRGRKHPVSANFFEAPHDYQLKWSDFRYDIHLDDNLVGYATKFYDGPFISPGFCNTGGGIPLVPSKTYYCQQLGDLPNCKVTNPLNNNCIIENKIWKDESFIGANTNMNVIVSMSIINNENKTSLYNSWSNYSDVNKRIEIDRLTVWQPVNCSVNRLICSKQEFTVATSGSSFLSGSNITIKACNNTNFNIFPGYEITNKENYHLLASNEIELLDEIFINEGAFLRAEIIDCNSPSSIGAVQKSTELTSLPQYIEIDEKALSVIEKRELDSLMKANGLIYEDSDDLNGFYKRGLLKSQVDNGSILLFPSPTADYLNIEMDEEDYNDILSLEIIDALGRYEKIDVNSKISVKHLKPGMYQLRFVFTHGFIVVKSFLKTE